MTRIRLARGPRRRFAQQGREQLPGPGCAILQSTSSDSSVEVRDGNERTCCSTGPSMLLPPRKFTVDEFYRLAEIGVLRQSERLELIDGEIIEHHADAEPEPRCFTLDEYAIMAAAGLIHDGDRIALVEVSDWFDEPDRWAARRSTSVR